MYKCVKHDGDRREVDHRARHVNTSVYVECVCVCMRVYTIKLENEKRQFKINSNISVLLLITK